MYKYLKLRFLAVVISLSLLPTLITSCASIKEVGKKLWGSSTLALEEKRGSGSKKNFHSSLSDCFDGCIEVLLDLEAVIFKKDRDKGYIVAVNLPHAIDTTEIGIFFETKGPKLCAVEIVSLNHWLQGEIAPSIFSRLEERLRKIGR